MTTLLELNLARPGDLARWWLGGYPEGGVFLPYGTELPVGARVVVELITDEPSPSSVMLSGTVAWRQAGPGKKDGEATHPTDAVDVALPTGIGIRFDPGMHDEVAFLERVLRGEATEARHGLRVPAHLPAEVIAPRGWVDADVVDLSARGLRVHLHSAVKVTEGSAVGVLVHQDGDTAALYGYVAWMDPARALLGLSLTLETPEERWRWGRVLTQWEEVPAFE